MPELDGIRAVAVTLVVAAHYGLGFIVPGAFGVTLFFFLSGYLITTLFYSEYAAAGHFSIAQFYVRRWLRLTPPLAILVVVGIAFHNQSRVFLGGTPVPAGTALAALFYYTNYYDLWWGVDPARVIPFGICWSLAVEEHFYALWPWLLRKLIAAPASLCRTLVGLCAAILVWRIAAHSILGLSDEYTYMASDCRIDSILYGALLRALLETEWAGKALQILRSRACQVLASGALLATFLVRDEGFRQTVRYSLQGIALMPLFTTVLCADPAGPVRNVLASGPMVLIGRLSYSIYLFHLLARTPGEAYFGSPFNFGSIASGLLLTLTISAALYVFVERPTARLRRRFRGDDFRGADAIETIASTQRQSARRNARTAALALDHPQVLPRGAP